MGSIITHHDEGTKPLVYVLDPYHEDAIRALQEDPSISVILPSDPHKHSWPQNATALLVRSESRLGKDELDQASPQLKYIVKQGVGMDNIDLDHALARGIQVYNTPGLNGEAVAELTIALALCISRRISEMDRAIRTGATVVRSNFLGQSLFGKTLGVIGMGNIGSEVAKKWRGAMEGKILAYDPYASEDAWTRLFPEGAFTRVTRLDEVLEAADVLTIHVPLTGATRNLISAKEIALMKRGAILLNCARGGIVDEVALLEALNSEHLFGAGLDAMIHEPPTVDHYGRTLLSHPRVILTPHVGASTRENQASSGKFAAQISLDLIAGRTKNLSPCLNA